ncbi:MULTISPECIES: hypothetical protein [Rhizobium]|uniref:hypothetical protein n=1 Tax=Rhizobium TaxID=379 RepID=UPI001111D57D|nr:hypothetical protein [Rhizobium miluonense]
MKGRLSQADRQLPGIAISFQLSVFMRLNSRFPFGRRETKEAAALDKGSAVGIETASNLAPLQMHVKKK